MRIDAKSAAIDGRGRGAPEFEIDGIERHASAAPDLCGPAKDAPSVTGERRVGAAGGNRAFIERLGGALRAQAARFQQEHALSSMLELQGERDAGGAGADDAEIGFETCAAF